MALRDLSEGMRGEDVRAVQQGLNEYFGTTRPALNPDGIFGPNTRAAVDAFQRANPGTGRPDGSPDGIVGRRTRRKLFPLAVVTVSAFGFRLPPLTFPTLPRRGIQPPNLGPGPLQPPGTPQPGLQPNPNANVLHVNWEEILRPARLDFRPQRFPGLRLPVASPSVPLMPRPLFSPDPQPSPAPWPGSLLTFAQVHHFELSPGSQVNLLNPSQTSFTLGLQGVAMIGDDDAAHQEFAMGVQAGSPNVDGSGDWSFTWYAQITDVDRFGALGQFHWWQPYAQLGVQNMARSFRPVLTGNLFPVNLGFDVNQVLTVNVAGGVALMYDPQTGAVQAGLQGTAGLILKFDLPARRR
jgi:peptidoglycan hydrolase-like protein with peptidoglycan-binding domain